MDDDTLAVVDSLKEAIDDETHALEGEQFRRAMWALIEFCGHLVNASIEAERQRRLR